MIRVMIIVVRILNLSPIKESKNSKKSSNSKSSRNSKSSSSKSKSGSTDDYNKFNPGPGTVSFSSSHNKWELKNPYPKQTGPYYSNKYIELSNLYGAIPTDVYQISKLANNAFEDVKDFAFQKLPPNHYLQKEALTKSAVGPWKTSSINSYLPYDYSTNCIVGDDHELAFTIRQWEHHGINENVHKASKKRIRVLQVEIGSGHPDIKYDDPHFIIPFTARMCEYIIPKDDPDYASSSSSDSSSSADKPESKAKAWKRKTDFAEKVVNKFLSDNAINMDPNSKGLPENHDLKEMLKFDVIVIVTLSSINGSDDDVISDFVGQNRRMTIVYGRCKQQLGVKPTYFYGNGWNWYRRIIKDEKNRSQISLIDADEKNRSQISLIDADSHGHPDSIQGRSTFETINDKPKDISLKDVSFDDIKVYIQCDNKVGQQQPPYIANMISEENSNIKRYNNNVLNTPFGYYKDLDISSSKTIGVNIREEIDLPKSKSFLEKQNFNFASNFLMNKGPEFSESGSNDIEPPNESNSSSSSSSGSGHGGTASPIGRDLQILSKLELNSPEYIFEKRLRQQKNWEKFCGPTNENRVVPSSQTSNKIGPGGIDMGKIVMKRLAGKKIVKYRLIDEVMYRLDLKFIV